MVNLSDPVSLGRRTILAGSWSFFHIACSNALRLASNLVMARLLLPEAFGLMALAASMLSGVSLLTDIGLSRSVTRDPEGTEPHYLRVVWTVQLMRSAGIATAILICAAGLWIAADGTGGSSLYDDPRLPGLVAAASLVALLDGTRSTAFLLVERQLRYGAIAGIELPAQLIGVLLQVAIALLTSSVWALMAGMTATAFCRSLMTHAFLPGPRMRLVWDREISARLWSFGRFLMASSGLTFAARSADRFIMASLLDPAGFGFYAIAQIWVEAGRMLVNRICNKVGFPAIVELARTRPAALPAFYARFQWSVDTICLIACLGCITLGAPLIRILYPENFAPVAPLLGLMGLTFPALRFELMNQLVLQEGNSRAMMRIAALRAGAVCGGIPVAFRLAGTEGAILAVALSPLVSAPYTLHLLRPAMGRAFVWRQAMSIPIILGAALLLSRL